MQKFTEIFRKSAGHGTHLFNALMQQSKTYPGRLVKAADRICAYVKCIEEQILGNREFDQAKSSIHHSIIQSDLPEVAAFMAEFVPSFELSLDELSRL